MRRLLLATSGAVLGGLVLAACGSSTDGTPGGSEPISTPALSTPSSSSPDSGSSTAPSTPPSSAPATSASTSRGGHPVPARPLRTVTVHASSGAVYAVAVWAESSAADCATHAYGKVATFLAAHDCRGVTRLLATTAVDGRAVGFAMNSVGFGGGMNKSYRAAGAFRTLVTENGTGNIDDLFRDGYHLPAGPQQVPSPDAFDALGQDAGVVVTDAWWLTGATPENDPELVQLAEDLFLQV